MNQHQTISQLLRWKFEQSAAEAPPPPVYRFVEEEAGAWWEMAPGMFQKLLRFLDTLPGARGFAADPGERADQPTVPVVIDSAEGPEAARGEILYFNISGGVLRLRFKLKPPLAQCLTSVRVTFVANAGLTPVLVAWAQPGIDDELRLEGRLSPTVEREWSGLRATSAMPFRLILQTGESAPSSGA